MTLRARVTAITCAVLSVAVMFIAPFVEARETPGVLPGMHIAANPHIGQDDPIRVSSDAPFALDRLMGQRRKRVEVAAR